MKLLTHNTQIYSKEFLHVIRFLFIGLLIGAAWMFVAEIRDIDFRGSHLITETYAEEIKELANANKTSLDDYPPDDRIFTPEGVYMVSLQSEEIVAGPFDYLYYEQIPLENGLSAARCIDRGHLKYVKHEDGVILNDLPDKLANDMSINTHRFSDSEDIPEEALDIDDLVYEHQGLYARVRYEDGYAILDRDGNVLYRADYISKLPDFRDTGCGVVNGQAVLIGLHYDGKNFDVKEYPIKGGPYREIAPLLEGRYFVVTDNYGQRRAIFADGAAVTDFCDEIDYDYYKPNQIIFICRKGKEIQLYKVVDKIE